MKRGHGRGGLTATPYRGYGSRREVFLTGRVFRQAPLGKSVPRRGFLRDLVDVARRIGRRGVAGASVDIRLGDNRVAVTTDRDGYFDAHLMLASSLPSDSAWHRAELWVSADQELPVRASAEVFIPVSATDLLVISDIDDTVMYTGVADKLRMLYRLFIEQPDQRMAFPGVAALYQALHRGADDQGERPILYVSRGPWAIYEMLETFFQLNRIPVGPILFLREWGISLRHPLPRRAVDHKQQLISRMLATFEGVPCVLIGDSGQHDPEVYTRIVEAHPGRIKAIYIRRVEQREDRQRAIQVLCDQLRHTHCDLVLAADSVLIAEHAHAQGFISGHGLAAVRREAAAAPEDTRPEDPA
ncbi:phosphatase domain-containing protein [Halomonas saccharevitans]|uniref:Phosphatase domain-containing protein n=1 Tax=Halomonas saccharevitans TaxID=416872 RepID=A0ABU3NF26_9GAMM|nr:phosphatase domain-containing protein [Halomonas saccharevitans]MDT8879796.1 phosphatase domain-containing protein [Halomonas saccharevitans]